VAKNDAPVEHWFHLGAQTDLRRGRAGAAVLERQHVRVPDAALVMRSFPSTVLTQTCHGAVARQMSYGNERGVPWGVSESAFNVRDRHQIYIPAVGVPDLALKRGLGRIS
jgi:cyclic beta-1,2-glucan synthetase